MPLEADAEREEVEQAVCVDLGKLLAEELASVGDMAGGGDSPPEQPSQAGHVKDDPSGNWSEHLTLKYKGAGASRVCLGYALPSGVRAIKGEGDRRRHHSGKYDFCYGTEVETGIKGRKYATSTVDNPAGNLLPKERKSSLDMDKLRKLGFDPKKHMMDPFFFLTLVFPMEDINKGGLQLRGFWDKICEWSNTYAVCELKLGGDKGHKFELRKSHHFIRWFGVVLMNGVLGGGAVLNRLKKRKGKRGAQRMSLKYNELMLGAMEGGMEEWIMTKRILKFNKNGGPESKPTLPDGQPNPDYNPSYKYTFPFVANQFNTVNLLKDPPLDLNADEESNPFGAYGEAGSGVVTNLNGKKCARGFQDVIVTEVGRARLIAFIHRHKKHVHLLNTGHTGPNEARLFIEQVLRMSKLHKGSTGPLRACDHGLSFPELYSADPSEQPHFTFDNHFQHNDLVDWLIPFDGVGMLSTVQRGRMPQFKADEVHKSKKGVTKATKAARNTNAITVVDVPGDGTPPKRAHISMQSTGETNFCAVRSLSADGVVRNWRQERFRGRGEHKRSWHIEMNTPRKLYLHSYNWVDVLDRMLQEAGIETATRRYHVVGGMRGFAIGVICAFSHYEEVYERLTPADFDDGELPERLNCAEFRELLAMKMMAFTPGVDQYAGTECHRTNTQKHKKTKRPLVVSKDEQRQHKRHCSSLREYHTKHGAMYCGSTDSNCHVCGYRTRARCTACNAPLCMMTTTGSRDCHARYHDPEYDMPLWVDMSRAQRAAFTYPKL